MATHITDFYDFYAPESGEGGNKFPKVRGKGGTRNEMFKIMFNYVANINSRSNYKRRRGFP